MEILTVIGVPGRIMRDRPHGGRLIPHDRPVRLPASAWLRSRLDAGDIALAESGASKPDVPIVEGKSAPVTVASAAGLVSGKSEAKTAEKSDKGSK